MSKTETKSTVLLKHHLKQLRLPSPRVDYVALHPSSFALSFGQRLRVAEALPNWIL
jgi:hypothetical protein